MADHLDPGDKNLQEAPLDQGDPQNEPNPLLFNISLQIRYLLNRQIDCKYLQKYIFRKMGEMLVSSLCVYGQPGRAISHTPPTIPSLVELSVTCVMCEKGKKYC